VFDVRDLSRLAPVPLRVLPEIGARVPGFVVRLAPAVLGALLCFFVYRQPALLTVGLVLSALAAVAPAWSVAWLLIVFLAASRLPAHASLEWRFFVLLFGLHLLDVLARVASVAPVRGWVQLVVFAQPMRRFAVIQLCVQGFAAVALWLLASGADDAKRPLTLGFFGVVGAVALIVVTLLLAAPLLRERLRAGREDRRQ
jgi:hypothetical protein